ncbi:carboxypeptidase regulatory-like domain-containing protein [Halobium salinum]|uniref:Carboxypeptidase regulatory-like domain-containing protein n=1 Tax=Halobium salinum TaxID=1364940 RepID=A0ABD5PBH3_9EURY|nr:carboxypeptidase regulatory-like domain-containing protein [Halobium salinum]
MSEPNRGFDLDAAVQSLAVDRLRRDERAIEGLPIRLVIALVVGVASLSVMMNMISGIGGLAVTELDARPSPEVVTPGTHDLEIAVVGADGDPVADATVVVKSGTAEMGGVRTATTDSSGSATVEVSPDLRPNQEEGTLVIGIKPPAGSEYADKRGNTKVLVVAG